jgi:DNA-directed RNA polymerase specialized sigma24 family protein
MSHERLRDRYPTFFAFGGKHEFLDTEGALATTVEGRIRSIWPYIVGQVLAFQKTLKSRERLHFDPEDTLIEIWVAVARKDDHWSPDRGRYITFAAKIIQNELCSIRDKAHTVQSPRNSSGRMKQYREEEAAGTLTDRRRKTVADIKRTGQVAASIGTRGAEDDEAAYDPFFTDDPLVALVSRERADGMRSGLRDAMQRLTPLEAEVVSRLAGLGGTEAMSVRKLGAALGRKEVEITRAKERAVSKIRRHLIVTRHPALHERN